MTRLTSHTSGEAPAVHGVSMATTFVGAVTGTAANVNGHAAGVLGLGEGNGPGVVGKARSDVVGGATKGDAGVIGFCGDPALHEVTTLQPDMGRAGVFGASERGAGVLGYSRDNDSPGVYACGGLLAVPLGRTFAGEFRGDVKVHGDIVLTGADCAERFDVVEGEAVAPGAVVVVGADGAVREGDEAYDRRVAGVVAGAGTFRPGIILDGQDDRSSRIAISLMGKAFCRVDARYGVITTGDLLTTSATPGHAMKATDERRSFGAIVGKALRPLDHGVGLIPILICLG